MGHELNLKSIPEDSNFFQLALKSKDPDEILDPLLGEMPLDLDDMFMSEYESFSPESKELLSYYDQLRENYPNSETYNGGPEMDQEFGLDLDRRYEKLCYLLCPEYRRNQSTSGLAGLILGYKDTNIKGTQGFQTRWSSFDDYRPYTKTLFNLNAKDLYEYYNPEDMEKSVYKFFASQDKPNDPFVLNDFEKLKAFYKYVSDHKLAVISMRD